jgi:hypothetical protein
MIVLVVVYGKEVPMTQTVAQKQVPGPRLYIPNEDIKIQGLIKKPDKWPALVLIPKWSRSWQGRRPSTHIKTSCAIADHDGRNEQSLGTFPMEVCTRDLSASCIDLQSLLWPTVGGSHIEPAEDIADTLLVAMARVIESYYSRGPGSRVAWITANVAAVVEVSTFLPHSESSSAIGGITFDTLPPALARYYKLAEE